jgi:polar amino acid transport system substrate-binding protein
MQPEIIVPDQSLRIHQALKCLFALASLSAAILGGLASTAAQTPAPPPATTPAPPVAVPAVQVPGFWDPRRRPERPDLSRLNVIRFLTETDFPPFNFGGSDGNPQGFNVDLARMLCEELKLGCTVQMRRFETLLPSLIENRGDAVIASLAVTPDTRARVDFTDPYYRTPARFAARHDSPVDDPIPERLEGKKVAVVAGTAHEAYLKTLFTEVEVRPYPSADRDSRYFGEGVGIAVKKGNDTVRLALNWALFRVWEQGRFTDLWLRYFPINPF